MLALVKTHTEHTPEEGDVQAKSPKLPRRRRSYQKRVHESASYVTPRDVSPIPEAETVLCALIWQSVIVQALYDLTNRRDRIVYADALGWFGSGNHDFEQVCDLAGVNKCKVLKIMKKVLQDGDKALEGFNFRTLRAKSLTRRITRGK